MRIRSFVAMAVAATLVAACGNGAADDSGGTTAPDAAEDTAEGTGEEGGEAEAPDTVNLSIGTGLAYAPLTIIREEGWLEERFPDSTFEWLDVTGGAATRDAMLAGEVDVGVSGTAPFLVGWDSGVDWKILGGQGILEFQLIATDDDIQTLEDLHEAEGQISAPSPDSGQAIALRKNAADALGDPRAFDDRIVAMGHPDAFTALLTDQTAAAYTSPPFQYRLVEEEGAHQIENGGSNAAFGPLTFTSVVMMNPFYEENEGFAQVFFELLEDAQAMLTDEPAEAAQILSESEGGETPPEQWEAWITRPENEWTSEPQGVIENGEFMEEIGMIDSAPESLADVAFPTVSDG